MPAPLTPETRAAIIARLHADDPQKIVAERFGVSLSTVNKLARGIRPSLRSCGVTPKNKVGDAELKRIADAYVADPEATKKIIAKMFGRSVGTVDKALKKNGVKANDIPEKRPGGCRRSRADLAKEDEEHEAWLREIRGKSYDAGLGVSSLVGGVY